KVTTIRFSPNNPIYSLGSIKVLILLSLITFYVILINILFLYYFYDIDKIEVTFNNLNNIIK
ncbi:glycosyl transferase, partial [Colletotrichum asianum]